MHGIEQRGGLEDAKEWSRHRKSSERHQRENGTVGLTTLRKSHVVTFFRRLYFKLVLSLTSGVAVA